jgi:hypothetical protein
MKDVIPLLQAMQADRNKDSMHKKEGMVNFFSYADSKNERISLVSFPEIHFAAIDEMGQFDALRETESNNTQTDSTKCLVTMRIYEDHLRVADKNYEPSDIKEISSYPGICEEGKTTIFRLMYDQELSFQSYLETKVFLAAAQVEVDTTELVETLK